MKIPSSPKPHHHPQSPGISAVALDAASPNPRAAVTFDSNQFLINFVGATLTANETFTYDLSFAPAVATTPEPSSILLLATGLLSAAWTVRRRRKG